MSDRSLYGRWVLANALAEGIGLGGSLSAMFAFFALSGGVESVPVVILMAVGSVVLGTFFEGVVVGWGQWLMLRRPLPALQSRTWIGWTCLGAGIAWTLGMLPSTIMSLAAAGAESGDAAASAGPPEWLVYLMAAGMGLVLGMVLSATQWAVLRRHVSRAGWWIPANALAWMLGMPVTFIAPGLVTTGSVTAGKVLLLILNMLAAGLIVGAVHGVALVRLLRQRLQPAG
jgi:hypothetical protein